MNLALKGPATLLAKDKQFKYARTFLGLSEFRDMLLSVPGRDMYCP
jgi:hypothetical protein